MIKTALTGVLLVLCVSLYSAYLFCLSNQSYTELVRRCSFATIIIAFILSAKCSEWIGCSNELCKDIQRVFWFSLISVFVMQILHYSLHLSNIYEKLFIFNGAIILYAVTTISASIRHKRYK